MKLSPPASSSDLEVARDIARRLHQRRRREDRPELGGSRAEAARSPAPRLAPPAPPQGAHASGPYAAIERPAAASEPNPPTWDPSPGRGSGGPDGAGEPDDALDALTAPASDPRVALADAAPAIEIEDEDPPAAAVRSDPAFEEADAYGGAPTATPFDDADALAPPDIETDAIPASGPDPAPFEPSSLGISDVTPDEEELFDETPSRPSWGDVAESCMSLAHARGALLADASGTLVAARGEWPEPGADAIASRLVAMMDRTLKDAPTRSVSAPVGALHLTAWRVPVAERLVTVVFIAETQVRADLRPTIDAEVQRAATA
jgi:hypothetical protein